MSFLSTTQFVFERVLHQGDHSESLCCRSKCDGFSGRAIAENNPNMLLAECRNPFGIDRARRTAEAKTESITSDVFSRSNDRVEDMIKLLEIYIGDDDAGLSKIILRSVFDGVLPWMARLLLIIDKLPLLAEDASHVLIGIVDLYVTTAFRLCAGNERNERILLGIDDLDVSTKQDANAQVNRASSPMFDFGLRSQGPTNRQAPVLSVTAEAELCALVPGESKNLEPLRDFLLECQKRMEGVAKLDLVDNWISDPVIAEDTIEEDFAKETARVMERRQGASCNHILVALALFAATRNIPSSCNRVKGYSEQVLRVFPLLISLCNRISCMRAICGRAVLQEVRFASN